jgi:hypothetical protein
MLRIWERGKLRLVYKVSLHGNGFFAGKVVLPGGTTGTVCWSFDSTFLGTWIAQSRKIDYTKGLMNDMNRPGKDDS